MGKTRPWHEASDSEIYEIPVDPDERFLFICRLQIQKSDERGLAYLLRSKYGLFGARYHLYERDNYTCVNCGFIPTHLILWNQYSKKDGRVVTRHLDAFDPISNHSLTKDHILPHSLGGGNGLDNLQTMCYPCNIKKGNTLPDGTDIETHFLLTRKESDLKKRIRDSLAGNGNHIKWHTLEDRNRVVNTINNHVRGGSNSTKPYRFVLIADDLMWMGDDLSCMKPGLSLGSSGHAITDIITSLTQQDLSVESSISESSTSLTNGPLEEIAQE